MKQFVVTFDTDSISVEYKGVQVIGKDLNDLVEEAGAYVAEDSRDFAVGAVSAEEFEISQDILEFVLGLIEHMQA